MDVDADDTSHPRLPHSHDDGSGGGDTTPTDEMDKRNLGFSVILSLRSDLVAKRGASAASVA
ncbi:hypothetical protein CNY89_29905, partial [Amaricoccus sp. HAR-UPW-R2A-40]